MRYRMSICGHGLGFTVAFASSIREAVKVASDMRRKGHEKMRTLPRSVVSGMVVRVTDSTNGSETRIYERRFTQRYINSIKQ